MIRIERIRIAVGMTACALALVGTTGCQSNLRGRLDDARRQQFRSDALAALKDAAFSDDPYLTSNAIEALGDTAPREGAVWIEKNLEPSNHSVVTFAALTALGTMREKDQLERFRAAASDPDPNVRIAAIYALHRCGDKSHTGELGALLTAHEKPGVRANAAFALGQMGDPSAAKVLQAALTRESNELARRSILEALAVLKDKKGVSSLMAYGYSADPGQATAGLWALGNARCTEAEGLFLDRLHCAEAPEVRLQAARGLGRIGYRGYDAPDMLDMALAHLFFRTTKVKDPAEPSDQQIRRVRALAALAAEAINSPEALQSLRAAFDAPGQSAYVRVAIARAALGILGEGGGGADRVIRATVRRADFQFDRLGERERTRL